MTTAEKYRTFIWITALLKQCGPISLADINERWLDEPLSRKIPFDRNTFRRYLNIIEEVFHITITCNHHQKYFIEDPQVLEEQTHQNLMLSNLQEAEFLLQFRNLGSRLQPMIIPQGQEYLQTIGTALRAHRYLCITYQKFGSSEPYTFMGKPYCLKAVDRRWYLLAQKEGEEQPKVFALDRMKGVQLQNDVFADCEGVDAAQFFQASSGIYVNQGPVERVVLKANSWLSHYLETLPLHHSQKQTEPGIFEYHMQVTPELEHQIFSHAYNVIVLEPEHLRKSIHAKLENLFKLYNN